MNWYKTDVMKPNYKKEQPPPPYTDGSPWVDILNTQVESSEEWTQIKASWSLFFIIPSKISMKKMRKP